MFTRCPYCQQDVPNWEYQNHAAQHGAQSAGRVPTPAMQYQPVGMPGFAPPMAPAGPVRQYYHPQCGGSTAMPPHILAQMAADPFAFGDNATCTGCGKQVAETELFWSDSGQSLGDYRQELKNNYVYANKLNPEDFEWNSSGVIRRKSGMPKAGLLIGGLVAGAGVLVAAGVAIMVVVGVVRNISAAAARAAPPPRPVRTFTTAPAPYTPPPNFSVAPPVYVPPPNPVYVPPPTVPTYVPPPDYVPPTPTPTPTQPPAEDTFARMRRENEERMAAMRRESEERRREMERRMNETRERMRSRFP